MPASSTPTLTIKRQDESYHEIEWDKKVLTIGRDNTNDIVIDHPLASRRHARLEADEAGYYIRDLNSTNGTYINADPSQITDAYLLRHQDQIIIADAVITFHDSEATARGPLPSGVIRAMQEEIRIDTNAKEVYVKGDIRKPRLTVKEFMLLELLYQRKGTVVSKEEIANTVWDYDVYDYNAIDTLIYRVRQRIEPNPAKPRYLLTQRGFGYKLVTTPEAEQ
jgi:pSer/pThr/pTyr-binding forkhead associated (FHA) protein